MTTCAWTSKGKIIAAYPFSIRPTRHRVELENGVTVSAMCAIDALGIPPMVNCNATIYSDTDSDDGVYIFFRQQQVNWYPPDTVVLVGTDLLWVPQQTFAANT